MSQQQSGKAKYLVKCVGQKTFLWIELGEKEIIWA